MFETILLLIIVVLAVLIIPFRRPKGFPPGPNGVIALKNVANNPQSYFEWITDNYGPLAGVVVPTYNIIIAGGKEAIMEVLSNPSCQGRPDNCLTRDRLGGKAAGIFFTEGTTWKQSRIFLLHHLKNFGFGLSRHEQLICEQRNLILQHIKKLNGTPFSFEDLIYLPNINIIWGILGGETLEFESKELTMVRQSLKDIIHNVSIIGGYSVIIPVLRYIAPDMLGYSKFIQGYRNIRSFVSESIKKHREMLNKDEPRDVIDIYLLEMAKSSELFTGFTEVDLEGTLVDMITASDTTVATLTFAIMHLCEYPEYQEKMYQEIMREFGPNHSITYDDRTRLVYIEAFLMELIRLKTPAPGTTPHRVMEDTVISGYKVPKHTIIFINVIKLLKSEKHWKDPEMFRPERFINDDNTITFDDSYIPFGKGKRSCLGSSVAKRSMFIWFTSLIQNFSISFPKGFKMSSNVGNPTFVVTPPRFDVVCAPRSHVSL